MNDCCDDVCGRRLRSDWIFIQWTVAYYFFVSLTICLVSWKFSDFAKMRLALILAMLGALARAGSAFALTGERSFDATNFFAVESNSSCGADPPTAFELQLAGAGSFANCSPGQFEAGALLDGDPATRWQSALGDSPVALTFSLQVGGLGGRG